jgi:hypothetical protein
MVYNGTMRNQIIKDSIKIGLLIAAILYLFVVVLPFIMSDDFDKLAIQYGLDKLGREIFWPDLVGK